ncbi:hypothetical protein [Salinivibrio sp. KP-1]|uniref:hypothetical protein n=1 Tax=Salinivibrio sp. KP-1 TaxID=1406902 RepID=UPI000614867A|nr:hypothetical protein [Salinivibrio sp. KP-1]KKA45138.1 hypothetical protein WN56_06910 [Salinivibrio sp. KP-1]
MSNIPIVVSVLALVLVGMLFGFNIQVSNSFIDTLTSVGGTLSGLGAMAAAYISYLSIGQWKEQYKHSLIYEYLSTLEDLLHTYDREFCEKAINRDSLSFRGKVALRFEPVSMILNDYNKTYQKAREIADKKTLVKLKDIEIFSLNESVYRAFMDFDSARKKQDDFLNKNSEEEITQSPYLLDTYQNLSLEAANKQREIYKVFNDALKAVQDIRSSL